jgi:hypothetical protein
MSSVPSHVEASHIPATQLSPSPQSLLSSQQPGAVQTGLPGSPGAPACAPASATFCRSTVSGLNSSVVSVHAARIAEAPRTRASQERLTARIKAYIGSVLC